MTNIVDKNHYSTVVDVNCEIIICTHYFLNIMEVYHNLVKDVLTNGNIKDNRTDENTISQFGYDYKIDLNEGYPLLTTKEMNTFRWDSMLHEVEWYLSGDHHIKELTEKTGIWDAWADENNNLPSAYGRFWRKFPVPNDGGKLEGEEWVDEDSDYVSKNSNNQLIFDQLKFVVDALNNTNPHRGPQSRRLIVSAWHPSNAHISSLPPCHFTYVFNVQNDKLNLHLTQRSADIALGIPFNIAAYSLLTKLVAKQTGYDLGYFKHSLVDAHIYCGKNERSQWYSKNIDKLQQKLDNVEEREGYRSIRKWILDNAPNDQDEKAGDHNYGSDHVLGLLEQISREPLGKSRLKISDNTTIDNVSYNDFTLKDYDSYNGISFSVAE